MAMGDFIPAQFLRKRRNFAILAVALLTACYVWYLSTRYELRYRLPDSRSKLRTVFQEPWQHLVQAVDHGCYLQTINFSQHRHSQSLLAERKCQQKLPVALVIGGALSGTETFKNALSFHPEVVVPESDLPFFYQKGTHDREQYRTMMPFSLPDQITVDASQEYMYTMNISKVSGKVLGKDIKVIVLVRDPVARAVSEYLTLTADGYEARKYHSKSITLRKLGAENQRIHVDGHKGTSEREYEGKKGNAKTHRRVKRIPPGDKQYKRNRRDRKARKGERHKRGKRAAAHAYPAWETEKIKGGPTNPVQLSEVEEKLSSTFEGTVVGPNGELKVRNFLIQRSIYGFTVRSWKGHGHVMIIDADEFARRPAEVMSSVESFLEIQPFFTADFFDFDLPKNKLCFNGLVRSCMKPIGVSHPLPVLSDALVAQLRDFFIPWMRVTNRHAYSYLPHLGEFPFVFTPFR